jgi:hypothetical protein
MPKFEWMAYYSRWVKKVFKWVWFYVALVSGLFALAIRYGQDQHSLWVPTVNHWAWLVPFWVFLVLGGIRIFIAPYILHKEDKAKADKAIRELQEKQISGPKWDNFLDKLNALTVELKYVLQQFVMQGCRMLEGHAERLIREKYHRDVKTPLLTIHDKTGFITSTFNGFEANPGIIPSLEQWAKTYVAE